MTIKFHSQIGEAAYHDLKRLLEEDAVSDIRGTPTQVEVSGRIFWYDKFRLGSQLAQRYIGPDSPELRARLEKFESLKSEKEARAKERTRLIRILRAEGYTPTDQTTGSLLAAFSRAGVFRLGGTLVGTVAFKLYQAELGVVLGFDRMAQTDDIDIASFERLSFALDDTVETPLKDVFRELKFAPQPSLEPNAVWRWAQSSKGTLVEFLMPAQRDEGIRPLPALGVSAQALRHLNFLLESPIRAVALYRSGVLVQIPRPEAYAVHKLIVAERRRGGADAIKSRKDRAQAAFLIEALAELRPGELIESFEDAVSRGPRWEEQIRASLERMPQSADILENLSI